jgi:RNA polymerase sigma-70 factor (ECF subfamily)
MDISSAFSQLSESDQEVLRLVYWEDLRRNEIAQVLGCSINVVNVRIHRALDRFRGALSRTDATSSPDHRLTEKKDDQ